MSSLRLYVFMSLRMSFLTGPWKKALITLHVYYSVEIPFTSTLPTQRLILRETDVRHWLQSISRDPVPVGTAEGPDALSLPVARRRRLDCDGGRLALPPPLTISARSEMSLKWKGSVVDSTEGRHVSIYFGGLGHVGR